MASNSQLDISISVVTEGQNSNTWNFNNNKLVFHLLKSKAKEVKGWLNQLVFSRQASSSIQFPCCGPYVPKVTLRRSPELAVCCTNMFRSNFWESPEPLGQINIKLWLSSGIGHSRLHSTSTSWERKLWPKYITCSLPLVPCSHSSFDSWVSCCSYFSIKSLGM